jgi:hypothetical protein
VNAALEAAWQDVTQHWDEAPRHDALLGVVAHYSAYAWLAQQYRQRGDDPIAQRQLERIRKAAIATMFATQTHKRQAEKMPFKGSLLVLLLVGILTGVGLIYLHFRQSPVTQTTPP